VIHRASALAKNDDISDILQSPFRSSVQAGSVSKQLKGTQEQIFAAIHERVGNTARGDSFRVLQPQETFFRFNRNTGSFGIDKTY